MDLSSPVLAWQSRVVEKLALECEKVVVLTSQLGRVPKMDRVKIHLFPRRPYGIPYRFGARWLLNFWVHSLCRKERIQGVFIHMAAEWSYLLFPCFRWLHLPVIVWYAHGTVSSRLRWAIRCVDRVVTSTPEGCRVTSSKIRIIGQGVDTDLFSIPVERNLKDILYVGRISRRKRIHLLIQVLALLKKRGIANDSSLHLVGPILTSDDQVYERELISQIHDLGLETSVHFHGSKTVDEIPPFYTQSFLHLSLSETGSMDKTVLEALACGCPALTTNTAFREFLSSFPDFWMADASAEAVARQVEFIYQRRLKYDPNALREIVNREHSLSTYGHRVLSQFNELGHHGR